MLECKAESAANTKGLGERIGRLLRPGDIVLLFGELGAGKTTLVQGIARGMGIQDSVTSPTFTLIQEYGPAGRKLIHVDPYRLGSHEDLLGIGIDEYLESDDVLVVEWGERLGKLTPAERLELKIEVLEQETRRIVLTSYGVKYLALVERLRQC